MGKTNTFRAETIVDQVISKVPSGASTDVTVNLPAGTYHIMIGVNPSVTGITTILGTFVKFIDQAQTAVSAIPMSMLEEDDLAYIVLLTLNPGTTPRAARLFDIKTTNPKSDVVLPHGFRFTITKGAAVTDEQLEIEIVASRVS